MREIGEFRGLRERGRIVERRVGSVEKEGKRERRIRRPPAAGEGRRDRQRRRRIFRSCRVTRGKGNRNLLSLNRTRLHAATGILIAVTAESNASVRAAGVTRRSKNVA